MDEIKNTTEAEEQKVESIATETAQETAVQTSEAASEKPIEEPTATPAEEPTTPAEETATPAESAPDEPSQAEPSEEKPAVEEVPAEEQPVAEPTSKAEVINRLKEIAANEGKTERSELDHLKMLYYRFHNAEVATAREKFIADGGTLEDFKPEPDKDEESFKAELSLIRELRNKAAEALEKEKQANLAKKRQIIARIKEIAASPDEADKGYNEVKQLQADWKEIKLVPAEQATELWKNYQLYIEQFYDQLRLNHEMRAYDFKKNLEIKTHLCEAAEKLAEVEDPISAFHQLQKLHQEWRETGPVVKDLREEIWKRFKDASTLVNKRHQEHFELLKKDEEENLKKKTLLCQQVEALDFENLKTYAQWDEMTKQVLALQAEWKTVGFTPRKVNAEIFERFRLACDRFFQAKTAYFKESREKFAANLAAKNALIEQAEALKDSTDWGATTNKLVALQKEWKTIGPVARKVSDAVWKRFNEACNYFFEQKNAANAGVREEEEKNLALKKDVIAELEKLASELGENALQSVRELQAKWAEIGHVPFSKKEKMYRRYRELCDKIYDALHVEAGRRRIEGFRKAVADKGGTELTREKARLQNILEAKRQELKNYETNLSFFRTSSKSGNALLADAEKKIEHLKQDLVELKEKISAVAAQVKAEQEEKDNAE